MQFDRDQFIKDGMDKFRSALATQPYRGAPSFHDVTLAIEAAFTHMADVFQDPSKYVERYEEAREQVKAQQDIGLDRPASAAEPVPQAISAVPDNPPLPEQTVDGIHPSWLSKAQASWDQVEDPSSVPVQPAVKTDDTSVPAQLAQPTPVAAPAVSEASAAP